MNDIALFGPKFFITLVITLILVAFGANAFQGAKADFEHKASKTVERMLSGTEFKKTSSYGW